MRYSTAYATGFVHLCRAHAESPSVSGDASRLLGVTLGECTDSRHGRVCDLCDAETIGASPSAAMLDQIAQLGRHAVAQGLRVRVTDDQIRALRGEATRAGDLAMAAICAHALIVDPTDDECAALATHGWAGTADDARADCADAIRSGRG